MAKSGKSPELDAIPDASRAALDTFLDASARSFGEPQEAQQELAYSLALKLASAQGRRN